MLPASHLCSVIVSGVLLAGSLAGQSSSWVEPPPSLPPSIGSNGPGAARFLQVASASTGLAPAELAIGTLEGPVVLLDAGLALWRASVILPSGEVQKITLDALGNAVEWQQALALDRAAAKVLRGPISSDLVDEIAARPASERHLVVAWLAAPDVGHVRAERSALAREAEAAGLMTRELADALAEEISAGVRSIVEPLARAAAERFTSQGLDVVSYDEYAPLVFLRADTAGIARLAADPQVLGLDWAGKEYADRLNVGLAEVRADQVHSGVGGVTGVGAKVSIVESTAVCATNPYMTVSATRVAGSVGSHTTGVGSCVASTHPTYKGIAPGATLISANGADFVSNSTNVTTQMPASVAAVSWSVTQGAHIMNLSYGSGAPNATVDSFDKYLDYIARNNGKSMAIACGNSGNYAGDPGAGYNQLSAGAFDDKGSSAWSGETMGTFSSWKNPNTGLEAPQMAAPGVNITMLTCASPWTGYTASGTSFSSPITAGAAALVVSKQPSLGSEPEPIRAILMASAWHNIEGAANLSSKDGAGGIDAKGAWNVAGRGLGVGYNYGVLTTGSFDAGGFYTALSAAATAGQTVRVCLSFDSNPSGGPTYSPDTLQADLDLYVYNPAGTQVATSLSGTNSFEVVQFSAATTGTYTVKIHKYSFAGTQEYFGVAFSTSADQ